MKYARYLLIGLLFTGIAVAGVKIQRQGIKTAAECVAGGSSAAACLPSVLQVYDTRHSQNLDTTIQYLDPTSSIQTQLNGKEPSLGFTAVPNTRTVNGLALSGDIALTAANVGAAPSTLTTGSFFIGVGGIATAQTNVQANVALNITPVAISALDIDWALGNVFTKTLSSSSTYTFSNKVAGRTIVVRFTNTASNYTVTWPTVKWVAGAAPTMTVGAKSDIYTFIYDGTDVYGSAVQNF
jgi:hypothetical protein